MSMVLRVLHIEPASNTRKFVNCCEFKVTKQLFVYGTLGPGRPNEHMLKAIGGSPVVALCS